MDPGDPNLSLNNGIPHQPHQQNGQGPLAKKPKVEQKPRYAVIHLPDDADVGSAFQSLIEAGFTNVSFLRSLWEHEDVRSEFQRQKSIESATNGANSRTGNSIVPVVRNSPNMKPSLPIVVRRAGGRTSSASSSMAGATSASTSHQLSSPSTAGFPTTVSPPIHDEVSASPSPASIPTPPSADEAQPRKTFTTFRDKMRARMELKNEDEDIFALPIVKGVPLACSSTPKEPKKEPEDTLTPDFNPSIEEKPQNASIDQDIKNEAPMFAAGIPVNRHSIPLYDTSSVKRYTFKKLHVQKAPNIVPRTPRTGDSVPLRAAPLPIHPHNPLLPSATLARKDDEKPPVPQRAPGVVYRKDYKNPPLPLPADDGTHVKCHLCDNKIMVSRLSNLTNHVRRHSAVKQYQCNHCNYQHNEQAKVRLHMTNNHQDTTSMPKDNLSKDMQKMWSILMEECFPGYLDQLKVNDPNFLDWEKQGIVRTRLDYGTSLLNELHTCTECGDAISIAQGPSGSVNADPLLTHLKIKHIELCSAQKCQDCGYRNAEEWKVRWHISARHPDKALDIGVDQEPPGQHMTLFLYKFFPSIEKVLGKRIDKEEESLNAAVEREKKAGISEEGMQKPPVLNEEEEEGTFADNFLRFSTSPELSDFSFPNEPKVDRSLLDPDVILCEMCNKILDFANKNSLCSLLAHAKRHFRIKQFECTMCEYSSSEAAHVRTHLLSKHESVERPKEHNNDFMQSSWLKVMKQCFPELAERIDLFKFKSGKSYVSEEESASTAPPVHNYGTRRKRTFLC